MKQVFIFTLSTCSHCKTVKNLLDEKDVTYDFTDVDLLPGEEKQKALSELREHNPRATFPTIIIDREKIIIGSKENEILEALELI